MRPAYLPPRGRPQTLGRFCARVGLELAILTFRARGLTVSRIARLCGVSTSTVNRILHP